MKQTPQVRNRPSPGLTAAPIFAVVLFSATPSQAADVTPLFQGEVAPITDPAPIRVRPNGGAFCVLHQRLISDEDDAPDAQIVTFDTGVEGTDAAAVVVQTVKGHRESAESPPIFGYQHRMTLDANGRPVATEARAIPGFPIDAETLRKAVLDGDVDIRDAIFFGRVFKQDDLLNRTPEETFRFLKPVIPQDLDLDALVDRRDQSRVAGIVSDPEGRRSLLFQIDAQMTTVRRSGATDTVFKGQVLVDLATGLMAGENWTARIDKTSTAPFELVTHVRCTLQPAG